MKNKTIFVACDTSNLGKIKKIINETKTEKIDIIPKFGLQFFYSKQGRKFLEKTKNNFWLDLKIHDIPQTAVSAIDSLKDLKNCKYITIHASGGFEMLRAVKKKAKKINKNLKILGVTVLTSLNNKSLKQIGHTKNIQQLVLKQTDLANTYRQVAAHGTDWFYKGPFAKKTAAWMNANDGVLSEADFAQYTITRPAPVQTTYRGYTVYGMPPPSSGGVHVIQILNMLEARNLKKINPRSADFFHLISESMKLAFADRAHWLGDPAFAKVPRGLMDKGYARKLAARIHPSQIIEVKSHGIPPKVTEDIFDKHTTHFSCADSAGNWVAITATINTHFGSKVVIPGTGVLMNNEMDDFAAAPGAPNAFGLLGAEANSVEPGKRPLSSMSPTLVLKGNQPVLAVGAAGGPTIITQTLLAMVHTLDYGLSLKEALAQPRFHHQWKPDILFVEIEKNVKSIDKLGFDTIYRERIGETHTILFQKDRYEGFADLRRPDGRAISVH